MRIRKSRLVELIKKSRQVGLFKWDELCLKFRIHISTKGEMSSSWLGPGFGKPGGLGLFTIQFECEEIILVLSGYWEEYGVPVWESTCIVRDPNFDPSLLGWFLWMGWTRH